MSWPVVKLREVAEIERDGISPENIVPGTPYLGLEHIEAGGRILSSEPVSKGELASTKFRFGPNHLLYGKLRPYLAKIALPDFSGICSTDIVPVRVGADIDKRYLAYFLRQPSMVAYASSRANGINLPRLSPRSLADFDIPFPPLPEQERIAAVLDEADDLRRKRRATREWLRALPEAIFFEMFGDPDRSEAAGKRELREVADLINGDRSKNYPSGEDIRREGVLFLNTTNIVGNELYLSRCNFITDEKFRSLTRGKLARGDVVITLRGALGQCALFEIMKPVLSMLK